MSNSHIFLQNRSLVSDSKVIKQGRYCFSPFKHLTLEIFISSLGIKIVKCSRCQQYRHTYIVDPTNSSSYSGYIYNHKAYDSVGLSPKGALHLTRQIKSTKDKRQSAKVERKYRLNEFLAAEAYLDYARQSKDLL